jgi:MtrB/PioB family decaheme-associated outer membrane protein
MRSRSRKPISRIAPTVAAAVGTALAAVAARADTPAPPPPDTSQWKCEQCPFHTGASARAQAGILYASGANASYGRYTGIAHTGAYADASASGRWRDTGGAYLSYRLDDIGLATRGGHIEGGREGRYELSLTYQGQPARLYDTTVTPYSGAGGAHLTLPAGWTAAGSTRAMTQLVTGLTPFDVGFDRRTVGLTGKVFAGRSLTFYADLSHQEKEGTGLTAASFLTDAVQLPQPIDYRTNSLEAGALWSGRIASMHLAYTGSWFEDGSDALRFDNPYLPVLAGATEGLMAQPPANELQQGEISGDVELPALAATTLTYSASIGRLRQDAPFLPVGLLPGSPALTASSLGGDVRLSHYSLSLGSRPISRLYVRGSASYDGRDDHTTPLTVPHIVTDSLYGGVYVTPRYGIDRTRLDGSADYRLFRWARIGVAGDYAKNGYSPNEVVADTEDQRGWVHLTLTPLDSLSVDFKGGSAARTAGGLNPAALPAGESLLLRAYSYAPRDEEFYDLSASWSATATLTWMLEGAWRDDAYRLTQLGLTESRDRDLSTTLTWVPRARLSVYADGGYQRLSALQNGDIGNGAPLWQALDAQYFLNAGGGGRWAASTRWSLQLDYQHDASRGNDTVLAGGVAGAFPQNHTTLDSMTLRATYSVNLALAVRLRYSYGSYHTSDWALGGVGPDTVPNLLAAGALPYRYDASVFGLSFVYRLGP